MVQTIVGDELPSPSAHLHAKLSCGTFFTIFLWLRPSLTCVPTWNPIAGHLSMRPSSSIYKRSTLARSACSYKKGIGIPDSDGAYDLESIRLSRPSHMFWRSIVICGNCVSGNDPRNRASGRPKNKTKPWQKARSYADKDPDGELATRGVPVADPYFFLVLILLTAFILKPEDKALYEEMLRLQGLGSNTETGVVIHVDEIMAIVRGGKQRGHIPGVGSEDKFSQMLNQLCQAEIGGGSGSGGRGDDEQGDDEDDGEDGEDEDDS
ncbi:hypothetical protein Tco_1030574 [Tanacetum coccineum]|uniref:Uncharacterized protein n=1 Tax=Tanacetum coccineum TaxID=301880 RepID=A0ABQ5G873_9ASTR